MNRIITLFIIFSLCSSIANAQPSPESADVIMQEAYTVAAKEHKKVFVIFHASWCGWCHKMDTAMNDPVCKRFFDDNFVVRHLVVYESKGKENLENPGALEMLKKYHGDGSGIPFWLIFDTDKNLLADSRMQVSGKDKLQNSGCPATKEEVDNFISVLRKTTSLSEEDLKIIFNRFRKNSPT